MTGDSNRAMWLRQARSYLRDADPGKLRAAAAATFITRRDRASPRVRYIGLRPMGSAFVQVAPMVRREQVSPHRQDLGEAEAGTP